MRRAVTGLLVLLLTAGCTVTAQDDAPRGPLVAEDVVRLDLRDAPTREEAGFAEGRDSLVLERVGDAIDTEVVLPGGTLRLDAFGVVLSGAPGERAVERVGLVVLNRRLPGRSAVAEALAAEAELLGLDRAAVERWADEPAAADEPQRVFEGPQDAVPAVSAEARPSSSDDSWTINYVFAFPGA